MKTYEQFEGDFLKIAETIQQRRFQMLIHSCIYYHLNQNLIDDKQWDKWARELRDLQNQYPEISKRVQMYEEFKDWDASTGAFLPITQEWVVNRAKWLLTHQTSIVVEKPKKQEKQQSKTIKKSLF